MESLLVKVADVLMELPEELLSEKDPLIASSIVKAIDSFSKINKVLILSRNKPLTEAKMEEIGREISKVLFYTSAVTYLTEMATDGLELETIKEYAMQFEDVYIQDAIMCSLGGIQSMIDLAHELYADIPSEEQDMEETAKAAESIIVDQTTGETIDLGDGEEMYIASVFASCFLLCERLELDFDNLIYNAKLLDKI